MYNPMFNPPPKANQPSPKSMPRRKVSQSHDFIPHLVTYGAHKGDCICLASCCDDKGECICPVCAGHCHDHEDRSANLKEDNDTDD